MIYPEITLNHCFHSETSGSLEASLALPQHADRNLDEFTTCHLNLPVRHILNLAFVSNIPMFSYKYFMYLNENRPQMDPASLTSLI